MTVIAAIESVALLKDSISVAAAIARRLDCELCIATEHQAIREGEREAVHAHVQQLRRSGLVVHDLFAENARQTLLDRAQRPDIQLVVIAVAPGDSPAATRLARRVAPAPTLVVRDPKPLLAWAAGRRSLRALACVDASAAGRATLRKLGELRRIGKCVASVAHVVDPVEEHRRLCLSTTIPQRGLLPMVERTVEAELHAWAEDAGLLVAALSFHVVRANRDVASRLAALARDEDAGLVLVGVGRSSGVSALLRPSAQLALVERAGNVLCVPRAEPSAATEIPRLRRVLVATDLSPEGNDAVPYAYSLVSPGGVVHLIHARVDPAEDEAAIEQRLRALVPAESRGANVVTKVHAPVGLDVLTVLASTAERLVVDAICLATKPRSVAGKALSRSIADGILRRCRRLVLMVPPQRHER